MYRTQTREEANLFIAKMREQQRKRTPEESKQVLVSAGILQEDGSFAPPYKALEMIFPRKSKEQ